MPLDFGRPKPEDSATFLAIVQTLHSESMAPAFAHLLKKELQGDDYLQLAHLFEEVSVLALHRLLPESLLYDAFAFDLYWDELREAVIDTRRQTGNEKFCENFEIAATRAREYRTNFPPKLRWVTGEDSDEGQDPPGGSGPRPPAPGPNEPAGTQDPNSARFKEGAGRPVT